jgi:protein-S-isoprenylcysteine O-methyltransferase Ste14
MSLSFVLAAIIFPVSEIMLALMKRAKKESAKAEDHGTMKLLWLVIVFAIFLAVSGRQAAQFRAPIPQYWSSAISVALIIIGLVIRWSAVITLGRMFTSNIAIQNDHKLVNNGLYKYICHPSYAGLLLEFTGLGFFFADWISLIALVSPITIALIIRMKSEEQVLIKALGESYIKYISETKRLIPFVW